MRYRKSVKICKGVKVNFSKSGASLTVGGKGASVSVGKKGTYLNTGIPGTGLYNRTKISGGSTNKSAKKSGTRSSTSRNNNYVATPVDQHPDVSFEYLDEQYLDDAAFTEVYKQSCDVHPAAAYAKMVEGMKPKEYKIQPFPVPMPDEKSVEAFLREQYKAETSKSFKLLNSKAKEDAFVASNIAAALNEHRNAWNEAKEDYLEIEKQKKVQADRQYKQRFLIQKEHLSKLHNNDEDTVYEAVDAWLSDIEFPFEFNTDYMLEGNKLLVDLDLPEIEDMPDRYYRRMADGSYKLKDKAQKTIKEDYYKCVIGLAMCFVTNLFKCAIGVNTIVLSAYTQRRDSKGIINDDYILSFEFDRDQLANMNVGDTFEETEKALFSFNGKCQVLSDRSFKTIEPL